MAALRIFACSRLSAILRYHVNNAGTSRIVPTVLSQIQCRWSSYKSSEIYQTPEAYTDYEISKDPKEWEYVERLLKCKTVPVPPTGNVDLPSGWKPACVSPGDYPYFIERSRNYMQPVYLRITHRGMRKITILSKIQGDIWALELDLKEYLREQIGHDIGTIIHEFAGQIQFKGDQVSHVKRWLDIKGF